jgi:hypothetical protein
VLQVARAFGFEFRRRHQWGLIALASYLAVFSLIKFWILGPDYPIRLDPPNGIAAFAFVPVTSTLFYFVGVFTYGLAGDLAARQSIYPARMFTLPVTSAALAGWPMLYGGVAVVGVYLAFALFMRIAGVTFVLPLAWPSVLLVAYLWWTQAFMWMPYGLAGLRVLTTVVFLLLVDVIVIYAFERGVSEGVMLAIVAPHLPLAYLTAWYAVVRARRGDAPDWRGALRWRSRAVQEVRRRAAFASPARAQLWFEWQRHGRSLPVLVALVLPFELWLLFIPGNNTSTIVLVTLLVVLLTPLFLAFFAAAFVSTSTPFTMTRPLTSGTLIGAKLKATIASALAAWLIVAAAIPIALTLSDTWPAVTGPARQAIELMGMPRAVATALLIAAALISETWKQLVQSLCIGLTGRDWLIKSTVVFALTSVVALMMIHDWLSDHEWARSFLWHAMPWILVTLVVVKTGAAFRVAIRLQHERLVSDRVLVVASAAWLMSVTAVFAALTWFTASPVFPSYFLGAIAILLVPLARVTAAPLALAWSRHR